MVRFYFMRHGETNDNVKQLCSTQPNSDADFQNGLTEQGILQCRASGAALASQLHDKLLNKTGLHIIHSGTVRTQESTHALIEGLEGLINVDHISINTEWRERDYGAFIGKPYDAFQSIAASAYEEYGIESTETFKKRIETALHKINELQAPALETLIISHGGCWDMLCQNIGISPIPWIENADLFLIEQCKLSNKISKINNDKY